MLQPRQVVAFAQDLLRLEERGGRLLNTTDDDKFSRLLFLAGLRLYFKSRKLSSAKVFKNKVD